MTETDLYLPQYVDEHREELRSLVWNGDLFIRTLALAVLIRGGVSA